MCRTQHGRFWQYQITTLVFGFERFLRVPRDSCLITEHSYDGKFSLSEPTLLPSHEVEGNRSTHDFRKRVDWFLSSVYAKRVKPCTISEVKGACSDDCATETLSASYPGALNNYNTWSIQVGRRRAKGLLGRMRAGERLAVLVQGV
jgi:hypothetical protein